MRLREFELARDYDGVIALWSAMERGVRVGPSDTRAGLALKLTRDPDLFLVAEADGQIVGSVIGGFDGRRGLVYHLAVAPAHRQLGLATRLMTEVEARLKAKGCRKCYLLVSQDNLAVIGFYERQGWQVMPAQLMGKEFGD